MGPIDSGREVQLTEHILAMDWTTFYSSFLITRRRDRALSRLRNPNADLENMYTFCLTMVLKAIERALRRREPYDSWVVTETVAMNQSMFDVLFGRLNRYNPFKPIYGSDTARIRVVSNPHQFKAVFGSENKYPARLFNNPTETSIPSAPYLIYYFDRPNQIQGARVMFGFRVIDEKGKRILEMQSNKKGESRMMVHTQAAFEALTDNPNAENTELSHRTRRKATTSTKTKNRSSRKRNRSHIDDLDEESIPDDLDPYIPQSGVEYSL